ncbi:lipoprotein [Ignatzschineria sp. LJL83]
MKHFLKRSLIISTIFILAACGQSEQTIQATNQLFTINVSSDYQDVMAQRDFIASDRLEGTPVENIILLQAKQGNLEGDLLYAVSLDLPEGVTISLDQFKEVMNTQMDLIPDVLDFKVSPVADSDTQITYVAETVDQDKPYFEYCRIAVESSITTICIGTRNDHEGAQKAIDSVQF